ncbi:DUF4439 domain-containing protein [Aeromicrobium sp. 636]|uniref:DUF4439 domain-containing protein n=1 Tax=Aeromicrobium senzhongii TaxID=2663859 RepID=A0A8I0K1E6_9ACTN|nr:MULTISPECIES: DUF4439 domain-containing protein [Aeromicrobium]MBC9224754.1 DUF4439 domain-containing protein [Aeromicrobium senzhongii]MCQ3996867.1 DUF4439 domain-containing protein [Aeromicrobium sp. 636]
MSAETQLRLTERWLALEHEAIWVLGLVGARFPDLAGAARKDLAAHRTTRDRLGGVVESLAGRPAGPRPSYAVTDPRDAAAARALVQDVESRIAATCVRLVAVTEDKARDRAVRGLRTAALGQVRWGAEPEPFPGLD